MVFVAQRPDDVLYGQAKRAFFQVFGRVDFFQVRQQWPARVPGHPAGTCYHVVPLKRGDREEAGAVYVKIVQQLLENVAN